MMKTIWIMAGLVSGLVALPTGAIATQPEPPFGEGVKPGQTMQCGPASAHLCPDTALFRQLPELMTPSGSSDTGSQSDDELRNPESTPYREFELLPHLGIVPAEPPGTGDILLERHPGDPG